MNTEEIQDKIVYYLYEGNVRVNALSVRERLLLLIALVTLMVMLWKSYLYDPLLGSTEIISKNIGAFQSKIYSLEGQIKNVSEKIVKDPFLELTDQVEALKKENRRLDENLKELTAQLIPPAEMASMLRSMLDDEEGLEILRVENIPEQSLFSPKDEDDEEVIKTLQVYRHGLEIEFRGTYFSTVAFLERLENLQWKLLWDTLDYTVSRYPYATVTLRVNTLSLYQGWIGV